MSHVDLVPTRRALVAQAVLLATVAGTGGTIGAVSAFGANPSPFEVAYDRYVELAKAVDETGGPLEEAERRYQPPPRPRYDHFRSEGEYDIEFTNAERTMGRTFIKLDDENIEHLKAIIDAPFDPSKSEPMSVDWDRQTHERRIEQAEATLAQIEEWWAEDNRRRDAAGLPAAEAAMDCAFDAMNDQVEILLAMQPNNLREVALMAIVMSRHEGDQGAVKAVDLLTELAGVTPYYKLPQQDAA